MGSGKWELKRAVEEPLLAGEVLIDPEQLAGTGLDAPVVAADETRAPPAGLDSLGSPCGSHLRLPATVMELLRSPAAGISRNCQRPGGLEQSDRAGGCRVFAAGGDYPGAG